MAALVCLAALWGASFLFIRIAAPALGPFALIELRVLLAGLALVGYAVLWRQPFAFKGYRRKLVVLGLFNAALPFTLIAAAELRLTASLASILNATTPLFASLVAAVWLGERLTFKRLLGLPLGVLGVAILVGWSPLTLDRTALLALGAMLIASLSYALGGVYAKRHFVGVPALTLAIGQQFAASLLLVIPALATAPESVPSLTVSVSVVLLALLCTAVAYLLYFYLIEHVGPTKTLTVTYLIPLFGSLWGVLFLKESLTVGMGVGLLLVLLSVVVVNEVRLPRRRLA